MSQSKGIFVPQAQGKDMTVEWQLAVRSRLKRLAARWPEEDSVRKAWARRLMEGNWNDAQHVRLAVGFLNDHWPTVSSPRRTAAPLRPAPAVVETPRSNALALHGVPVVE